MRRFRKATAGFFLFALVAVLVGCEFLVPGWEDEKIAMADARLHSGAVGRKILEFQALGVIEDDIVQLEFYLYADSEKGAKEMAANLNRRGFGVGWGNTIGRSTGLYLIQGFSPAIQVSEEPLKEWVEDMVLTGYEYGARLYEWEVRTVDGEVYVQPEIGFAFPRK